MPEPWSELDYQAAYEASVTQNEEIDIELSGRAWARLKQLREHYFNAYKEVLRPPGIHYDEFDGPDGRLQEIVLVWRNIAGDELRSLSVCLLSDETEEHYTYPASPGGSVVSMIRWVVDLEPNNYALVIPTARDVSSM